MLLHINPTRQRGKRTGYLARASGWYMTFFAAGVISPFLPQSGPNACAQRNETGSPETTSNTLSIATSHQPRATHLLAPGRSGSPFRRSRRPVWPCRRRFNKSNRRLPAGILRLVPRRLYDCATHGSVRKCYCILSKTSLSVGSFSSDSSMPPIASRFSQARQPVR